MSSSLSKTCDNIVSMHSSEYFLFFLCTFHIVNLNCKFKSVGQSQNKSNKRCKPINYNLLELFDGTEQVL